MHHPIPTKTHKPPVLTPTLIPTHRKNKNPGQTLLGDKAHPLSALARSAGLFTTLLVVILGLA